MTIKDCIDIVDNLKPNQYTIKEKVAWLTFIEQIIINEVIKTHEGYDGRYDLFEGYSEDKLSVALIVPSPYDRVYVEYLKMKIDSENGETARYNNSAALYNAHMLEFRKHYNKTHMPLGIHSAKHFPSAPGKVNTGLSEAEYENLKKDMTHILTEYFSDSVSEDKLNDAVSKYIQNNREAFKGKDGKTPVKGVDYFTDEELNSIHSKCEDKIANSAKTLTDHLDDEMSRRLSLKENTINKVDAVGDAEDKGKCYPSVFCLEAYGEELKSEIKNHYDIILDGKEDKSNMVQEMGAYAPSDTEHYPSVSAVANEISNAVMYLESEIPKRYATKEENTLKLDKSWRPIADRTLNVSDVKTFALTEGKDWGVYGITELLIRLYVPASTDKTSRGIQVTMFKDTILNENGTLKDFLNMSGSLFVSQSAGFGTATPDVNTVYVFESRFLNNGNLVRTTMSHTAYGAVTYPQRPWVAVAKASLDDEYTPNINGKNGIAIKYNTESAFPAGTILQVFGR